MVKDAELHAEEDKKRREEAEVKNEADTLVFRAEKALSEFKDKLPQNIVSDVETKIADVKKALEGSDLGRIKSAKEALDSSMQHIGEAMSKAQAAAGGQNQAQAEPMQNHQHQESASQHHQPKEGEEIQDAEVEILNDDDK